MFASSRRLLARIGRWPRRIAALACLLLAAGSALVPQPPAASEAAHGLAAGLRPGQVAVPVPVAATGGAKYVHPGDHVGMLAAPADGDTSTDAVLVADQLRVLSVDLGDSGLDSDASAVVVIATDRADAVALARYVTRPLLVIVDDLPRIQPADGAAGHRR